MELHPEQPVNLRYEDLMELVTAASEPATVGQRVTGTVHTTVILGLVVGAWTAGTYATMKFSDWLDQRNHKRQIELAKVKANPFPHPTQTK